MIHQLAKNGYSAHFNSLSQGLRIIFEIQLFLYWSCYHHIFFLLQWNIVRMKNSIWNNFIELSIRLINTMECIFGIVIDFATFREWKFRFSQNCRFEYPEGETIYIIKESISTEKFMLQFNDSRFILVWFRFVPQNSQFWWLLYRFGSLNTCFIIFFIVLFFL